MANAKTEQKTTKQTKAYGMKSDSGGGMVYFTGFVGALIYFIQAADNFWEGVLGLLKALVWPAYIVYKLLESFYGIVS